MKRISGLLLVVATLAMDSHGRADPPPEVVTRTIEYIRDFARAPSAKAWLGAHPAAVTPAIAETAAALADDSARKGGLNETVVAAQLSGAIYMTLGQRVPALTSMMKVQQARFMLADTPAQYAKVSADSAALAADARAVARPDLEFEMLVNRADASFFQSEAEQGNNASLLAALRQTAAALPLLPNARSRDWIERMVSLTGGVVTVSTEQIRSNQNEIDAALKGLAPLVEKLVPLDFEYHGQDAVQKTHNHMIALSDLSYRHGQGSAASARLAVVERRAIARRDTDGLLAALWLHYRGERRTNARSPTLAQLRRQSIASVDQLRAGYRSRTGRLWAAYRADVLLGEMVADQLRGTSAADLATAFAWVEELKSRMLLDRISAPPAREISTAEAKRLEHVVLGFKAPSKDQTSMAMTELRLVSQLSGFNVGDDGADRHRALDTLEGLYGRGAAGLNQGAQPASLADIQRALQPGEVILEYLEPYSDLGPTPDLWVLQISHNDASVHFVRLPRAAFDGKIMTDGQAPVEGGSLVDLVVTARVAIRNADDGKARRALKDLHALLVRPLLAKGLRLEGIKRLIVVPHGALHYVPFAALLDDKDRYLISRAPVVVVPSASIWRVLQARTSAANNWVAFVDPKVDDPKLPRLEFAAQEGEWIGRLFPAGASKVFPRENATWTNLRNVAPTTGHLHFATHGEFPDDDALDLHSLLIAPERGRSILLRAADVRALDLHATKLVALSVCNGGLYRIGPANEPYGLMPAFLEAGAQNVLGTLWPMDDQFGRDFMIEFYKHLAAEGPAGAYQKASKRFIDDGELLRHWAGFVMVGPGRPPAH